MLTPPYSSKIADYANPMANRVQLQLITTDLSVQNRSVQLYVEIKGNGLTAASAPVLSGVSPLRINGGEILRLTNAELASYFQLRNLQGITSQQYTSALPDGMYSFCFRVKDVLSGRWLSQSHCAIAYLMLNDPPILNIPTDNEQVAVTDFQNIIFSWTPRQINATNITYSFELREILDPTLDPRFAFEVSRRILKEDDLRMTTFVYDVSKPNLIPGRRYAWRVRAISTGGLAENSVFKNDGYSEVHSFVYAVNCSKPLFLLSQQQGKNRTKLLWQGHTLHQKYHIQYRKKGVANAQWFEASTRNTQTLITDLEAGEYEFRVGATCETERYGINPSYVYSDIQTFEIEKTQNTTESAYNCGIVPKIAITNQKPLGSLVTNEVFVAGDFSVTILEVSGNNGIFSGKGFIKVPYLNDTKLAVEFENIKINADYQLTDGIVKTTFDSDWKGVQEIKSLNEVINNLKTIFKKKKLTEEDVKSLQELKKQWDFYLSNANGIGISEEDKTAFKEIGAKMFSASVEKLSKEERKVLVENTEKAEKLYDKYKDKFEQYTAKKEEEAHDDVQINEIVEALLNLKGKAFLKCKKCEEKPIKYTEGNYNNQILNLNTKKNNFKCILGEYDHKNNVNIITLQRKKESSVGKNEIPTTKIEQYIKSIQDKKDSFLLIAQENDDLLECTNRLTFSKNFCSVKETEIITKEDEKHIIEELKNCLNNNQAVISLEELKNIEKELLEIKKQLHKEQAFEWTYKGKIYKLNAKNKVEEVQNPLSNTDIIKGNWKGMQEEKKRFYRNEEGFIQLSAFGYRSDLPILEGKKADLEEISKHILNQTNAYFSDLRSLSQQAPQLDEDAFADGKKIEIRKNTTKFQVFIEGIDITKNLIKTGKVAERVYLDKTNEEAYIKVPGIVTGSTEAGLSVITDITAAVVMIYDIAVDEEVRKETYNGLVKIKDEIKENPSQLFPLLKDVILEAVTGNTSEDWEQTTQEETDKGKKSHLLSKGAVKTTMSVVVGGKIITELPEISKKIAAKMANLKNAAKVIKKLPDNIQAILNDVARFSPQILDEMKIFLSKIDFNILEKLCKAKGFDKVLSDMALHWKKFRGGKFQIEYAKKLLTEGKIISFEVSNLSDDLHRIYDIKVEYFIKGELKTKLLELKNWNHFYPETIKNQFLKDLQNMNDLGDIQWIFAKTDNIRDLDVLKSKVLQALKAADGKPIKELEKLFEEPSAFTRKISKWLKVDDISSEAFLQWMDNPENFKKIFEIVN
jgi:fibronectin type III domain protein